MLRVNKRFDKRHAAGLASCTMPVNARLAPATSPPVDDEAPRAIRLTVALAASAVLAMSGRLHFTIFRYVLIFSPDAILN